MSSNGRRGRVRAVPGAQMPGTGGTHSRTGLGSVCLVEPERAGDDAWIVAAGFAFAGDNLIAAGPVGAADGLPFDVRGIGVAEDLCNLGVGVEVEDFARDVHEDGDFAHP